MQAIKITAANLAQSVIIDTPCTADWNEMTGSDSVRFCHSCKLNVYNIAQFSDSEAQEIFSQNLNGNRICTRIYRRPDGTVMTDNCPRALRRLRDWRNRTFTTLTKVAALATLFLSTGLPASASNENDKEKGTSQPSKSKSQALQAVEPVVSPDYAKSPRNQSIAGIPAMPNLSNYMQQLNTKLLETWKKAGNPKEPTQGQLPTSVSFTIDSSGAVSRLKVIKSSKQAAVDKEALKAVKNSVPLPPPPPNSGPLTVEFKFEPKPEQQTKEQNDGH